jgi:hypothetical protein
LICSFKLNGFSFGRFFVSAVVSCPPYTFPLCDVSYLIGSCDFGASVSKCSVGEDVGEDVGE